MRQVCSLEQGHHKWTRSEAECPYILAKGGGILYFSQNNHHHKMRGEKYDA